MSDIQTPYNKAGFKADGEHVAFTSYIAVRMGLGVKLAKPFARPLFSPFSWDLVVLGQRFTALAAVGHEDSGGSPSAAPQNRCS